MTTMPIAVKPARFGADIVRKEAEGKWRDILSRLNIAVPAHAKKHGPCPTCGGKDRFRFDDQDGRGMWFCNQCRPQAGDGFALVQNVRRCDFPQSLQLVADALGLQSIPDGSQGKIVAEYNYTDAAGNLLFQVVRLAPKDFRQRRPDGHGGWVWNLTGLQPVLYKLPDVLAADHILIVEGEKDVEMTYRLGLPDGWAATCNPMGAGKWRESYSNTLAGKHVVILPDADAPGETHAAQVAHSLQGKAATVQRLALPEGFKDLSLWAEGQTSDTLHALLAAATLWRVAHDAKAEQLDTPRGPWSQAQTARDFLSATEHDVLMLYPSMLARGSITECFSPRGIGKTHAGHWLAVTLAKQEKRVLLLDRDNARREVKRRLKAWGAEGLLYLKVLTRDAVPPLTDTEQWRNFPFQDYDLVLIDSLESSTEGCGEQDSAKPSRALAPLLDIAHRENGPAILILGNTIKSGAHSRGSGVVEDRADVAFEVRDATNLTPSGTKDWWLELPAAGAEEWANRASRRTRRDTYRLAFIASKYRIGEEPAPFIWEIAMPNTGEPWILRDVTAEVVQAGADAKQSAEIKHTATLTRAADALVEQARHRAEAGDPMLSESDAVPYLVGNHDLTRKEARQLLKDRDGTLWVRKPGQGKGHPLILMPVRQASTAAKMPGEESPLQTSHVEEPISAGCMNTGRRKSANSGAALSAGETALLFSPPGSFIQDQDEVIDAD